MLLKKILKVGRYACVKLETVSIPIVLKRSVEVMKQKVKERFDVMRAALQQDEQAVRHSLELDRRETSAKLNQVLKDWQQHLSTVQKNIRNVQNALTQREGAANSAVRWHLKFLAPSRKR